MTNDPPPIEEMRREYIAPPLREADVDPDPIRQFALWFDQARHVRGPRWFEPNAMTLATCGLDGVPAARIVLLKHFDDRGFVFYTDYASDKGRQLQENPQAGLLFHWPPLERQIRVTGSVTQTTRDEAQTYFHHRPRASQLGAAASGRQSEVVESRQVLETRLDELDARYRGEPIPMPDQWGGYRIAPHRFEFWQGRPGRLHDRLLYTRQADGAWKIERLTP